MPGHGMRLRTVIRILSFHDPDGHLARLLRSGASPDGLPAGPRRIQVYVGNVILDEGAEAIWRLLTGDTTVTPFNTDNACIGVGDGTNPEDPKQTGLTGVNTAYKLVDRGYPMVSARKITFRATFGPDEANFSWQEITVANGCSNDAVNLNRRQQDMGTKNSGDTWMAEVALEIQ